MDPKTSEVTNLTLDEQTALESAIQEAEILSETKTQPLDEFFLVDSSCEVLDEAVLTKLKGLPPKENREMVLRLKVGQAGVINGNNRYYPRSVMEREVKELSERIEKRAVFSNDQHPRRKVNDKGQMEYVDLPTFASTTFIPLTLEMNEQGELFSTGVVPSTDAGKNYAAIIRAGGRPGVSTRGGGSTKKGRIKLNENQEREVLIVQDDFKLKTFDTVFDQSLASAGIAAITESQEQDPKQNADTSETMKTLNEWKAKFPEAATSLVESVRGGGVKLKELSSIDESLYGDLCEAVRPELEAKLNESKEEEIRRQVAEMVESEKETITAQITDEELEEAKAVAMAEFLSELGVDEEIAAELRGIMEEQGPEAYNEALRFTINRLTGAGASIEDDTNPGGVQESMHEADVEQIVESSEVVKNLQSTIDEMRAELGKSKRDQAIAECLEKFPYNAGAKEKVRAVLESLETEESVRSVYESQVNLLKEAGAKEESKGSAKFLAADGSVQESQQVQDPQSLDESLIAQAAKSFQAA